MLIDVPIVPQIRAKLNINFCYHASQRLIETDEYDGQELE